MSGKKRVYIETSIISYLTSLPSRNLLVAAWQSLTTEWWDKRRNDFDLFASELVMEEASRGDPLASKRRIKVLDGIPFLKLTDSAIHLSQKLISKGALPSKASDDALHISLAAIHRVDYLLTWNCKHIDNAENKPLVRAITISEGYHFPEICTPNELLGGDPNEE
ncbi:MAG: type II toxin-antitoxin system VapC family toxin [Candidatus Riflebacteria bacterium]|nr:type II toxin-antitoxin system VapC family toxin [Candidatus Riflebacteria bacterium]